MAIFCMFLVFLEQPKRCGCKQTTSMSSFPKETHAKTFSFPKLHPQISKPHLSDLEQRTNQISSQLDEGNMK